MRLRSILAVVCLAVCSWPSRSEGPFAFRYSDADRRWDLSNGILHAAFQLTPEQNFSLAQLERLDTGTSFKAPAGVPSSPISFRMGGVTYDASTAFSLVSQSVETPDAKTQRQVIVLEDLNKAVRVRLELEMAMGQAVLHHRVLVTNQRPSPRTITAVNLVPYSFASGSAGYQLFRVSQWDLVPQLTNFQTSTLTLSTDGTARSFGVGSGGTYCAWMALKDAENHGVFAGVEFDGATTLSARHNSVDGFIQTGAAISSIYHSVDAGETMALPGAFIGLFEGAWDDAGYATQTYSEVALAKPKPNGFPWVVWDSWAYQTDLDEVTLKANADKAADLGMELFLVDLGWANKIGDWHEDPVKFPSGLRSLSDYVHSRGMKFGLHFALAEADPDSPVLRDNPDWTSSKDYNYYGAKSLCLSNKPTRDWVIQQAIHLIDFYGVDYLLQDGQDMVKTCTKSSHTHDYRDSNYSNAVDGINYVIGEVQRLRPNVIWENCENGGNMMTFNMLKYYTTSITNDASGALGSRQSAYGATYPFSPRYTDRYMPEDPTTSYVTRSYMFGGPWHFMNRLPEMTPETTGFARKEIEVYKKIRSQISSGMVYHITAPPLSGRVDGLQSYDPVSGESVAVVTREGGTAASATVRLQGLRQSQTYVVSFQDDSRVLTMTGGQLMLAGVRVNLPKSQSAEIVYVRPNDSFVDHLSR